MRDHIILQNYYAKKVRNSFVLVGSITIILGFIILFQLKEFIPVGVLLILFGLFMFYSLNIKLGLLIEKNVLYNAKFWKHHTVRKRKVEYPNAVHVVILKFKMRSSRGMTLITNAVTDGEAFYAYELHLLNENHNDRNRVVYLDTMDIARKAAEFIDANTRLTYYKF